MGVQYLIAVGALGVLLLFLFQKFFKTKRGFWEQHGVPELPAGNSFLRLLKSDSFKKTYAKIYKEMGDLKYGGLDERGQNVLFVKDLDLAKKIFVKDFEHFANRNFFAKNDNDEAWNSMLMNKEDKEWKDLRSLMSPTFTSGKLRRMFPILQESGEKLKDYVDKISEEKEKLDIQDALGRYCLDAIISLAFGIDSETFKHDNSIVTEKAKKLTLDFSPLAFLRMFLLGMMPSWMRKSLQSPFLNPESGEFFATMIKKTIKHREQTGERRNDFLQLLLDAKHGQLKNDDNDGELATYEKDAQLQDSKSSKDYIMTDDLIAANCILMILGGYETTKLTIILAAYALAVNPEIQEKLRKELQDAMEENGGELSYDIINTHEYLDKVVNEVLRFYPPGLRNERTCTKDYTIEDTKSFVPKEARVWIPVYEIHYDEKYFPNPKKFDPERFSPEVKATRHPYAYMPFGHGPRNCIANRFALVMTKAGLSSIILNFFVEPTAETKIPLKFKNDLGSTPAEPVQLKLTPRK